MKNLAENNGGRIPLHERKQTALGSIWTQRNEGVMGACETAILSHAHALLSLLLEAIMSPLAHKDSCVANRILLGPPTLVVSSPWHAAGYVPDLSGFAIRERTFGACYNIRLIFIFSLTKI